MPYGTSATLAGLPRPLPPRGRCGPKGAIHWPEWALGCFPGSALGKGLPLPSWCAGVFVARRRLTGACIHHANSQGTAESSWARCWVLWWDDVVFLCGGPEAPL